MWPVKEMPSRFQLFKAGQQGGRGQGGGGNAMQKAQQSSKYINRKGAKSARFKMKSHLQTSGLFY
jgi:hypothetical protein